MFCSCITFVKFYFCNSLLNAIKLKNKGFLFAAISAISYGLLPIFIIPVKKAGFSLDVTLFYRFFISFVFVLLFLLYKKVDLKISKFEVVIMLILGLFYALSSEFLFLAYDYLSPGIASTILFVYPIIVALILFVFYKEKLTKATVFSLIISFAGVLVLSAKDSLENINFIGLLISFMSAVSYALYIVLVNKSKISFSGIKISLYSLLFSSLYYLIKILLLDESIMVDSSFLFNTAIFSLVTTVFSMVALVEAIKLIGSTSSSIMGALEPVVAVGISVLMFNEEFTLSLFIGLVLILFGVIVNIVTTKNT